MGNNTGWICFSAGIAPTVTPMLGKIRCRQRQELTTTRRAQGTTVTVLFTDGGGFRVQVSSGFSWFFQEIGAGPAGVGAG